MRILWSVLLIAVLAVIAAGCSEDKKQEAAKLEKELMERQAETPAPDTAILDTQAMSGATAPEEKPVVIPAEPQGTGYVVQVASCESPDYADSLVDKYTGRGYQAFVTSFDYNGQTYYRVRLGPFDGIAQAERTKQEVMDKYSVNAWIDYQG